MGKTVNETLRVSLLKKLAVQTAVSKHIYLTLKAKCVVEMRCAHNSCDRNVQLKSLLQEELHQIKVALGPV